MARPKKSDTPDTSQAIELTTGAIDRLIAPDGKQQAFLRDSKAPGLRVRVTNTGAKAFVFEAKLNRQTVRRTIGDVRSWTIEQARAEARKLAVMLDGGTDPREVERQKQAEREAEKKRQEEIAQAAIVQSVTVAEAWAAYIKERTPQWGARHAQDHTALTQAGGSKSTRGTRGRGVTIAGPLYYLMSLPLVDLTPAVIEAWATEQAKTRPTSTRLAWRLLRAFLTWCSEHPTYQMVVSEKNPAKGRKVREAMGKQGVKTDALLKEQLPAWFAQVRMLSTPAVSAALQVMLLTGARPGEVLGLKWADIKHKWKGILIRDKVEGTREIPLTPYVAHLLATLPRRNEWVFASPTTSDHLSSPNWPHQRACTAAGIDGLTLHGLRRSFKSLTEWLEVPAGVVAQIMGHKPSATAEKHYTVRPLDLLRLHHERIEAWILDQAGVTFDRSTEPGKLTLVAA